MGGLIYQSDMPMHKTNFPLLSPLLVAATNKKTYEKQMSSAGCEVSNYKLRRQIRSLKLI